ncbi:MAG: hypothetical protein ACOYXM_17840 [Actinomycetota bacterium]
MVAQRRRVPIASVDGMDETGLPEVGDVFMTGTLIFNNGDHAIERPIVVVRAPRHRHDYVTVIQRSSTPKEQKGVDHPCDETLRLNKDGRWVLDYQRSVRCDELLAAADHCGTLSDAYLTPLVEMWEQA